ncbi:hypothetical protein L1987_36930 [Smallanthus sonchifolius]|uniref:Uncharacterized protein n=1 Tax=Smallanthus sonchifolius TaxID=185202 RepID=A0ACB9HFL9_9ASTR|nr:hypothetical protein L1987_36930 [Smallanthus sonchifolius]
MSQPRLPGIALGSMFYPVCGDCLESTCRVLVHCSKVLLHQGSHQPQSRHIWVCIFILGLYGSDITEMLSSTGTSAEDFSQEADHSNSVDIMMWMDKRCSKKSTINSSL